jgi:hypothetical protein
MNLIQSCNLDHQDLLGWFCTAGGGFQEYLGKEIVPVNCP